MAAKSWLSGTKQSAPLNDRKVLAFNQVNTRNPVDLSHSFGRRYSTSQSASRNDSSRYTRTGPLTLQYWKSPPDLQVL